MIPIFTQKFIKLAIFVYSYFFYNCPWYWFFKYYLLRYSSGKINKYFVIFLYTFSLYFLLFPFLPIFLFSSFSHWGTGPHVLLSLLIRTWMRMKCYLMNLSFHHNNNFHSVDVIEYAKANAFEKELYIIFVQYICFTRCYGWVLLIFASDLLRHIYLLWHISHWLRFLATCLYRQ